MPNMQVEEFLPIREITDWLCERVSDAWPDLDEASNQLGGLAQLPVPVRPYRVIRLPVIPFSPGSFTDRVQEYVYTITRKGVYSDTDVPLLYIQTDEVASLMREIMAIKNPLGSFFEPMVKQIVLDEDTRPDEQTYETTIAWSIKISRPSIIT